MRSCLALSLLLAALALPSAALAAAPRDATPVPSSAPRLALVDLVWMGLGLEPVDRSDAGLADPDAGADSSGEDDDADGAADETSNSAGAGSTANEYSGGAQGTTGNADAGHLGNGSQGGAPSPEPGTTSASMRKRGFDSFSTWLIGIIFGQDRPWSDKQVRHR